MSASWTIQQLGEAVEAQLAGEDAPANGQVRAVPDARSIRYYTTLGLLDRPTMQGRTALYGRRHLAQLVAIKRLQAEGLALAEIQRVLPTFDDAELARRTGVDLGVTRKRGARRDFWRTPEAARGVEAGPPPAAPPLTHVLELMLAPGVRLAFRTARPATDADASALIAAAAPLLAELTRRRLIPPTDGIEQSPSEAKDSE